jgi:hypothetical protein
MTFARRVFSIAGIYGLIVLVPQYFLETKNGHDFPPTITHPEYYYGFIGVGVACQILFLIIARDPVRYRAMMIPSIVEKFSFGIAIIALFLLNRVNTVILALSCVDLVLGILFIIAYAKTPADYIRAEAKNS